MLGCPFFLLSWALVMARHSYTTDPVSIKFWYFAHCGVLALILILKVYIGVLFMLIIEFLVVPWFLFLREGLTFLTLILALPQELPRNLDVTSLQRGVIVYVRRSGPCVPLLTCGQLYIWTESKMDMQGSCSQMTNFKMAATGHWTKRGALLSPGPSKLGLLSALEKTTLCDLLRPPLVLQ